MNANNATPQLFALLDKLQQIASLPLEEATALPPELYTSGEILDYEKSQIFEQQWLCAGRSASIPNTGDYLTYQINEQSIAIIRQQDGSVAAFANVCQHRMMKLLDGHGVCPRKRIICPYHAWAYGIDGKLIGAPQMSYRPSFELTQHQLPSVRCELWHGWIYVTLNPELEPVSELLAELHDVVDDYQMEHYVPIVQEDHVWQTNWKFLTENFMEGYHLPVAHKGTVGPHFPVNETLFSHNTPNPHFTFQYFKKRESAPVGNAHPANTRLQGQQRNTSILPTVFPSHMYALAPDHLWYLSLQPMGFDQVRIRYGAAIAPEVLAHSDDPEALIANTKLFLDKVNAEDRYVVEGIMQGAKGSLSKPGPLCWLERENHEFTQYLARQLDQHRPSNPTSSPSEQRSYS